MLKSKTKSTIIIFGTLFLGVIIGGMVSQHFVHSRIENMAGMAQREGFLHVFKNMIDPSEEQIEKIHLILEKHHQQFQALTEAHMLEINSFMDSLRSELKPILTKEQFDKIKNLQKFMQHRHGKRKPPRGPGHRWHKPVPDKPYPNKNTPK